MAFAHGRYYKKDAKAQSALSFLQNQNNENNIILITVGASWKGGHIYAYNLTQMKAENEKTCS